FERIVHTPPKRRRRPRRRLVLIPAAAAGAPLAVALPPRGRPHPAALAPRASAATATRDGVLYTELFSTSVRPDGEVERSVTQIWQHGDRSHRVRRIVDADGRTRTFPNSGRPWECAS